ncbi:CPBP family intramembrane glutamic endopeptidase [Streptococcus iniae]
MRDKLTTLRWFDILVVTIILFTDGIINSTKQYLALLNQTSNLTDNLTFSSGQNYQAFLLQSLLLLMAIAYLYFRRFDFSVLTTKINVKPIVILQAILIFIVASFLMDLSYLISYQLENAIRPSLYHMFSNLDFSLVLYSFLNGFYEEIFFLGICLSVKPDYIKWAFLYSLLIRTSFHTYQGLTATFSIGLILGTLFYVLYRKLKPENLLPFFLAHAIADMIGLSVIFYFWQ